MKDIKKPSLQKSIETQKILKKVITANRALAKLNGVTHIIPNSQILINSLVLREAKDSSEIENIITTHDELFRAGIDINSATNETKEVEHYRQALLKGYDLVREHKLLLKRDIIVIQKELEQNGAGVRRQSGTVLRNMATGKVVFEPPQEYEVIQELLTNLEQYINEPNDLDPLVNMAIIHYQFESIHPFYDGNGRTGRIVNILYLILKELLDLPILYLSSYIIQNKADYYRLLQEVRTKEN
jgi:Fic family protein